MRKKQIQSKAKQGGMSLLNIALAIMIGGVLTIAAVSQYKQQTISTEREIMKTALVRFFGTVKQTKQAYHSYSGISNNSVWQSDKLLNSNFKSSTANKFITPYSDDGLDFAPASTVTDRSGKTYTNANAYISAKIKDVPIEQCTDVVDDYIDQVLQVTVGTTRITNITTRDTACATGNKVDITLING